MVRERPWGITVVLLLALVMAGTTIWYRVQVESASRVVEIALDYDDIKAVAQQTNQAPLDLVKRYHEAGMTSLVLVDDQALHPDTQLMDYAQSSGLILTPQLTNQPGLTHEQIMQTFVQLDKLPNVKMIFFRGYEVYGYPSLVGATAQNLSIRQWSSGMVEFLGEQKGQAELLNGTLYRAIRIHPGYPYDTRSEIGLSVKDRGNRYVFLKPFKHMNLQSDPAGEVERWVRFTQSDLKGYGLALGRARPLPYFTVKPATLSWIGAGVVSALVLLLGDALAGISNRWSFIIWAVGTLAIAAANIIGFNQWMMAEGLAWAAAVIFPTWGIVRISRRFLPRDVQRLAPQLGIISLLEASGITLAGALMANAALSDIRYLLAWRVFRGVKAAFLVPLVLVAVAYLLQWTGHLIRQRDWRRMLSLRNLVIAAVVGVVLAIYVMRSGNVSAAPLSPLEATLRQWLEQTLRARPRTKEFLIGHPALLLAAWASISHKRWVLPLLLIAATGQISIFNTFVHLHTPIQLSLLRTAYGLVLGIVIGLTLVFIAQMVCDQRKGLVSPESQVASPEQGEKN